MRIHRISQVVLSCGVATAFALVPLASHAVATQGGQTGSITGTISGFGKGPTLVYVDKATGPFTPADPPPVLGQKNNTYVPHVLPVLAGSKVEIRSQDPELHNVYAWAVALKQAMFNIAVLPHAAPLFQKFNKEGVVRMTCNVHKEMLAYVVVLQNPFWNLVDKGQTKFEISGVPAGKYELRVWGEKLDDAAQAKRYPVEVRAGGATSISLAP